MMMSATILPRWPVRRAVYDQEIGIFGPGSVVRRNSGSSRHRVWSCFHSRGHRLGHGCCAATVWRSSASHVGAGTNLRWDCGTRGSRSMTTKEGAGSVLYAAGSESVCRSFLVERLLVFQGFPANHDGGRQEEHKAQEDKHPARRGWRSHDV